MNLKNLINTPDWTLFLDRDGVINRRIENGYVRRWEEFSFLPGVEESLVILSGLFGKLIVVSNQQGIGKGLITDDDVQKIHERMILEVESAGGKISAVFYCGDLSGSRSVNRKPNIGMALQARKKFPDIRFRKSVMVGDSLSDMIFGKRVGMQTVLISDDLHIIRKGQKTINYVFRDLKSFANSLVTLKT